MPLFCHGENDIMEVLSPWWKTACFVCAYLIVQACMYVCLVRTTTWSCPWFWTAVTENPVFNYCNCRVCREAMFQSSKVHYLSWFIQYMDLTACLWDHGGIQEIVTSHGIKWCAGATWQYTNTLTVPQSSPYLNKLLLGILHYTSDHLKKNK